MHLSLPELTQQPEHWARGALGAICFSAGAQDVYTDGPALSEIPHISLPLMLDSSVAACELWLSNLDVREGQQGDISYRYDDEMLFGVIEVPESGLADKALSLQLATESAYKQIFALLDAQDYPYIYRFWNYMADINSVSHGLERYRQFNRGRQSAFIACHRQVTGQLPAACALGTREGGLKIAFLASRIPARAIENPRQTNAYEYPEQYGPSSPTFSRAALLSPRHGEILLISGTASVVGHQTLHTGNVAAQTRETLNNLETVITEANRQSEGSRFELKDAFCRVYLRSVTDLPVVRDEIFKALGPDTKTVFTQADICREDLLLEIEAAVMPVFAEKAG